MNVPPAVGLPVGSYLEDLQAPGVLEARAIVFEGPEDYHQRINDPALQIDDR